MGDGFFLGAGGGEVFAGEDAVDDGGVDLVVVAQRRLVVAGGGGVGLGRGVVVDVVPMDGGQVAGRGRAAAGDVRGAGGGGELPVGVGELVVGGAGDPLAWLVEDDGGLDAGEVGEVAVGPADGEGRLDSANGAALGDERLEGVAGGLDGEGAGVDREDRVAGRAADVRLAAVAEPGDGGGGDATPPTEPSEIADLGGTPKENSGHTAWVDGRVHQTGFTATFPPNTVVTHSDGGQSHDVDFNSMREGKTDTDITYAAVTARSHHPDTVNAATASGSVITVESDIDQILWRAFATRNGGESIGNLLQK